MIGDVFVPLIPSPTSPNDSISADDLAAGDRRRIGDRPWVGLCMVASLDGAAAVGGRSEALSDDADMALFGALRRAADVVIVGAATARSEGYGPPRKAGQRLGVVTSTGDIDIDSPLFSSRAGFLIMPEDGPRAPVVDGQPVDTVRAGIGRVDLAVALTRLDDVTSPPTFVQVEGGPRLNASLADADCVDEVNLTVSPRVVGGEAARIVAGADEVVRDLVLVQLARAGSFLFGRWQRAEPT